jgi:adenylate cyclase
MNYTHQKNIKSEENRAKTILYNMLPSAAVHDILHSKEDYVNVGNSCNIVILFSDIVGFTPLSAKLPPLELVKILDTLYQTFDLLVDNVGLWKMVSLHITHVLILLINY